MMRTMDQTCKMTEANSEIWKRSWGLFSQQSAKIARKEAALDATVVSRENAKDCGDFCMVEKGWFVGNQQEYVKIFI
eukprot:14664718-Ditylum_brightwellii.AAC.1